MTAPVTRYFVQFQAANGMGPRFIGEQAQLPWRAEEAALFETRAAAKAAFEKRHAEAPHHFRTYGGPGMKIRQRTVIISKPIIMEMLGL